jgi:hypothetical protein
MLLIVFPVGKKAVRPALVNSLDERQRFPGVELAVAGETDQRRA